MALPRWCSGVDPSWVDLLDGLSSTLETIDTMLADERDRGATVVPDAAVIMRVLTVPVDDVRVLIIGQDPYPTPGHAVGWAFATAPAVRPLPRSLVNIYRELRDDLGIEPASHGDLSNWVDQGVMLLNAALTARAGEAGSHRHLPWRIVTEAIVERLVARGQPLVAVLWGNDARWVKPLLRGTPTVESAHPSPLSARRGFFGSRPFSRVNAYLEAQGAPAVDWRL